MVNKRKEIQCGEEGMGRIGGKRAHTMHVRNGTAVARRGANLSSGHLSRVTYRNAEVGGSKSGTDPKRQTTNMGYGGCPRTDTQSQ